MSTTTTAPALPSTVTTIESTVFASLPGMIGLLAAGKLGPINATVQADLVSADSVAAEAIDKLHAELDTLEASNPLVVQAIACFKQIVNVLGLELPPEDQVVAAVKEAVHDVLAGLKPAA